MKTSTEMRKGEKGFSLLELLLVVGVGALLLLAGIATYRLVVQGNNVNEAIRVLATIKQQTQRAFQGQRAYAAANGDDLVPTLVAMEAFPAGVLDAANLPYHPWGGLIDVTAAQSPAGAVADSFDIVFNAVPTDACIQLGSSFDEEDSDFILLDVAGTVYNDANPIDVADLATNSCAGGPVVMTWQFF